MPSQVFTILSSLMASSWWVLLDELVKGWARGPVGAVLTLAEPGSEDTLKLRHVMLHTGKMGGCPPIKFDYQAADSLLKPVMSLKIGLTTSAKPLVPAVHWKRNGSVK